MQANVRLARNLIAAALLAALAAACQMAGLEQPGGADAAAERAARQSRQGDHAAAARNYESAARSAEPADRNGYWLAAGGAWIAAGEPAAAETALANLAAPLTAADVQERQRLQAELALLRGDAKRAEALLRDLPVGNNPALLATRARMQFATLRVADAVMSLVARERLLSGSAEQQQNQRLIVDGIGSALARGADGRVPAGTESVVAGWMELGRIISDARSGALGSQRRLQFWRERYPGHPAHESLWKKLPDRPVPAGDLPQQIALLLPLSGRSASAGLAVRDGFLGAYYDDGSASRPRLRIYDVAAHDAPSSYLQAIADGSDFVVGPLTREEVASLATLADGRATTLALNFLPDGAIVPDGFFQYALSPEDEARLVARRLVAEGRTSGVTLTLQTDWGRRIQAAFAEEFAAGGGQVVDRADYPPSTADFNELLRRLLQTTGQRGSVPRRDAQFIFVAAQPVHGRLIRTQLRFNYASSLPMYATSDIFDMSGPGAVDLNGVIFPDMPWVLDPEGPSATAREAAERAWPGRSRQLGRLHAFGYDAFRIVSELRRLRGGGSTPLPGLTGRLTLDDAGRLHRELDWAQIIDGKPVPLPSPGAIGSP
ncbi:MAG: penicillin-binding protein activator [Steroidobacteraceae bacterium]